LSAIFDVIASDRMNMGRRMQAARSHQAIPDQ